MLVWMANQVSKVMLERRELKALPHQPNPDQTSVNAVSAHLDLRDHLETKDPKAKLATKEHQETVAVMATQDVMDLVDHPDLVEMMVALDLQDPKDNPVRQATVGRREPLETLDQLDLPDRRDQVDALVPMATADKMAGQDHKDHREKLDQRATMPSLDNLDSKDHLERMLSTVLALGALRCP
jgi:hypothetical protein